MPNATEIYGRYNRAHKNAAVQPAAESEHGHFETRHGELDANAIYDRIEAERQQQFSARVRTFRNSIKGDES